MSLKTRIQGVVLRSLGLSEFAKAFITGSDMDGVNTSARLLQPYRQSAWVRAAINFISGEVASRPVKFYDGEKQYGDDAFADWWAAPALGVDSLGRRQRIPLTDVLEQLTAWAKLRGEFFLLLDDAWALATASRNPAALTPFIIADPGRMRLIMQSGVLAGYEYIDPAGRRFTFVPEQVVHWHNFNPCDPCRGLGDLDAAMIAAEAAHATGVYIRDLMRNNNDQGCIVVGKNGVATDEQRDQVTAALRAKRAALARGVAHDLFLTGEIAVERAKEQAAGADLHAGKSLSHQEIFIAFGVPPSMAEVKASYSIGSASDRYQLITGTCMPLGTRIAGAFAQLASRQAGRMLTAELEWDDHPVMVEVRSARVDTGMKLWGAGMPMKKVNDYLNLGMSGYAGWEVGYLPFSVAPAGAEPPPEKDPALAEPAGADPAGAGAEAPETLALQLAALVRTRQRPTVNRADGAHPIDALFACACHEGGEAVTIKARDPREIAQWRTLMSARRETVASCKSAFGRVLMQARRETLRKISECGMRSAELPDASGKSSPAEVPAIPHSAIRIPHSGKSAAADLLFDLEKFRVEFRGAMEKQTRSALQRAGQQLFKEIGRDDPFTYPPPAAIQFLQARQNKLAGVPDEIFADIKTALEEGLDGGETMAQLSDRVRAAFNGIDRERADRIAMTETAAAYGSARDEAMQQAGVPYKRWLTSGNDNVRAAHAAANGQTVDADAPFIVDGEALSHPGDTRGSPANVINCHCVAVAVATANSKSQIPNPK